MIKVETRPNEMATLKTTVNFTWLKEFKGTGGKGMEFMRITVNPNQMGGVPCIRGLRIPVATVVGMVAEGMTEKEILEAFPDLEREDIREAL